jgi:hypothetical protein
MRSKKTKLSTRASTIGEGTQNKKQLKLEKSLVTK